MAVTRNLSLLLCYLSVVHCVLILPKDNLLLKRGTRLEKSNLISNILEIPSSFSHKLLDEHRNAVSETVHSHHNVQRRDVSCALDNRELESVPVCVYLLYTRTYVHTIMATVVTIA